MPRVRLIMPSSFQFSCKIPTRITDLNYGGHTGNDTILSLIHEARMQYLKSLDYTEMKFENTGMIMSDVIIEYKKELFYPDTVTISVTPGELTRIGFDLFYKLESGEGKPASLVAIAKTHMICYDYDNKKIVSLPEKAREKLLFK